MSDSLWPHRLQHSWLSCPSLSSGVCSNSRPLSRWCHPTILSCVTPFSSCSLSFPASASFPKSQPWILIGRTDTEAEVPILWPPDAELTLWKRPQSWERLRAGEEGDNRGWDGWMASSTQWTWVWTNSEWWWRIGKPGMLQSMGSQRVRHN